MFYSTLQMIIDRNFYLWSACGTIVNGHQLNDFQSSDGESHGLLLDALFPEINESLLQAWLSSKLNKKNELEYYLLQRDFENAIRNCRDSNLAAVISSLPSSHYQELLQKQIRKWQQDGTSYLPAWEILAADDSHYHGVEAFSIRLNYKYADVTDFRQRLASSLKSSTEQTFWVCLIKYALGEYSGTLHDLLSHLNSPKTRLEVVTRLGADDHILQLLKTQIQESSHDHSLQSLLRQQRYKEAGEYLSVTYPSIPFSELFPLIDLFGEHITQFSKLHLLKLYHQKPPGHDVMMEFIMNADIAYLPKERVMREEMAQYLAKSHARLVFNDLSPDSRLHYLHQQAVKHHFS